MRNNLRINYTNYNVNPKYANRALTFEEWVNVGYRSAYMREQLMFRFRQSYLLENDLRPRTRMAGFVAFPYHNFKSFDFFIKINDNEYKISFK